MGKFISHEKVMIVDSILQRLGSSVEPFFAYSVSQNRSSLEPIVTAIKAAQKMSPAFTKFEEERQKLLQEYAKKDAQGRPVFQTQNYGNGMTGRVYDIEDRDALEKAVTTLSTSDEFKHVVEDEEERRVKLQELMDQEVEIDVFKIKMSDAPKNLITGNDMTILLQVGILEFDLKREDVKSEGAKKE